MSGYPADSPIRVVFNVQAVFGMNVEEAGNGAPANPLQLALVAASPASGVSNAPGFGYGEGGSAAEPVCQPSLHTIFLRLNTLKSV